MPSLKETDSQIALSIKAWFFAILTFKNTWTYWCRWWMICICLLNSPPNWRPIRHKQIRLRNLIF